SNFLSTTPDYLLWYGRDREQTKYRPLFRAKGETRGAELYSWVELPDGTRRKLSQRELADEDSLPAGARLFRVSDLGSQGPTGSDQRFVLDGREYLPRAGTHWSTTLQGLGRLLSANRIVLAAGFPAYARFLDDY